MAKDDLVEFANAIVYQPAQLYFKNDNGITYKDKVESDAAIALLRY